MFLSRALAATLAVVGFFSQYSSAHSTERNPLRYVSRVDEPTLHTQTQSRRVHALSSFEVSFLLHRRRQKVRLTLAPNHDILARDAVVQYLGPDGVVHTTEKIDRMEHKIYQGDAFVQREGHTEWTNVGWARINVHRDGVRPIFEGAFRIDGDNHHIQTDVNYRHTKLRDDPEIEWAADEYMVVWRDSDVMGDAELYDDHPSHGELRRRRSLEERSPSPSCSSDGLDFNAALDHPIYRGLDVRSVEERLADGDLEVDDAISPRELFGRQNDATTTGNGAGVNLASTIGSTAGCPGTRKVALVGIATDCTYSKQFNSTASIRSNIIQQVNAASQLYESTFNISLGIQNLTISEASCPARPTPQVPWNQDCGNGVTITDRLYLFSAWRGSFTDKNAFWTLLTTCNTDAAVGLAWLGQLCVQGSSKSTAANSNETIAGANVVVKTSTEWQVFAHEVGHTFGAVHDCTATTCSDGSVTKQQCCPLSSGTSCDAKAQFIMNPSTGTSIKAFSPCSVGNICSAIGRSSVKSNCLASNKDVVIITGSQCGNGIVEQGEDCDCGGPEGCKGNPCCNPATCKFTTGSSCDFANEECCTSQCRFASAGTTCRPSSGSCDPAETCTGSSGVCPQNTFAPNGQACGDNLACASGQCTSRNQQCKTLMGSLTTSNDTYACSSSGCQLSCASPEFGRDTCFTMMQNFLDGTPCQGGGKCSNGWCEGSSLANEIGTWLTENKGVVIPVASTVGGLVLLALVACCIASFRRRQSRRSRRVAAARAAAAARLPKPPIPVAETGWVPGGGASGGGGGRGSGGRGAGAGGAWSAQNAAASRHGSYANIPRPPPHAAGVRSQGQSSQYAQWGPPPRQFSARYA